MNSALIADEHNPEALQLSASLKLSQEQPEAARILAEQAVNLWLPSLKEAAKPEGTSIDPVESCSLTYPARLTAARLLVEVESYELAAEILELLLDEEDQVVEVWYLLGWLNKLQGNDYSANARYYLARASDVSKKTGFDDMEVNKHIQELLDELGPPPPEDNDENMEDGDEDACYIESGDDSEDEDMETSEPPT